MIGLKLSNRALSQNNLRLAVLNDPAVAMTWFELGAVRYNQGQWADASNWIERAYLCDTNNAEAVLYLSRSLAEQGQLEKASLVI